MVFMGIFNLFQLSAQFLYCIYVLACVTNEKQQSSWLDSIIGPFNKIYFNMSEYYNCLLALNRLAMFMIHGRTIRDQMDVFHKVRCNKVA
uniref:Secreted protein n=1 Tax=Bursaphelenchus xylophilus TaxID=6326 RepID=A0A1I7SVY8_BURXY